MRASDSRGVSERAIENWLAKASERSYQTAFCHLLGAMGYTVVHSTSHGPAEEGKDVIALDRRSRPVAFQLKRGSITPRTWREFEAEIIELVELPIRHPSISGNVRHCALLVTTGYIHELVSSRIQGRNQDWAQRGFQPLATWSGSELLAKFCTHTGAFLPQPIPDFHRLLGFMIGAGDGLLDKDEFSLLLGSVLPVAEDSPSIGRAKASRAVASAAVMVEYAMAGFDKKQNHYARIEAYTMLACYVLATAARLRLPKSAWSGTFNLIESALDACVRLLAEEAVKLDVFGQGSPMTDPFVAPYRAALVVGALSAHGLWCMLGGKSEWFAGQLDQVRRTVKVLSRQAHLPAESVVPAIFLASQFLRHHGAMRDADAMFKQLLKASVLRKHPKHNLGPLWGPYLPLEDAILRHLGKPVEHADAEAWEHLTHTAWPLAGR